MHSGDLRSSGEACLSAIGRLHIHVALHGTDDIRHEGPHSRLAVVLIVMQEEQARLGTEDGLLVALRPSTALVGQLAGPHDSPQLCSDWRQVGGDLARQVDGLHVAQPDQHMDMRSASAVVVLLRPEDPLPLAVLVLDAAEEVDDVLLTGLLVGEDVLVPASISSTFRLPVGASDQPVMH